VFPGPLGPFVGTQIAGVVHPVALALLFVGVVGLGLLALWHWAPAFRPRRYRPRGG
jgi:hypothetical protein